MRSNWTPKVHKLMARSLQKRVQQAIIQYTYFWAPKPLTSAKRAVILHTLGVQEQQNRAGGGSVLRDSTCGYLCSSSSVLRSSLGRTSRATASRLLASNIMLPPARATEQRANAFQRGLRAGKECKKDILVHMQGYCPRC